MLTIDVETPVGPGRLSLNLPDAPRALIVLGHGAGGGIDTLDLAALADSLPQRGVAVARYEQPWRLQGKRVAPRPPVLDEGWRPALAVVQEHHPGLPLIVGGRSAGARVACRCFAAPALGVVALSFPLHPPGKPDASRIDELAAVPAPVLLLSGAADPFGSPTELSDALRSEHAGPRSLEVVPDSTHSFRQRAGVGAPDTAALVTDAVARFIDSLLR